jgi:Phage integrase family
VVLSLSGAGLTSCHWLALDSRLSVIICGDSCLEGFVIFRIFHDLRHSFASFLVNEGVSLYVVQALLGHANARTTQRYAHLASDTLTDATEIVDGIVTARPPIAAPSSSAQVAI